MQSPPDILLPNWLHTALTSLVSLLAGGGIVKAYNVWLKRKLPAAEINQTEAETLEINVRSTAAAGDSVMRMMDRLVKAQADIDRLRSERDEWKLQAAQYKSEAAHELKQREKAIIIMKAHGLSYGEFDEPPPDVS